MKLSTKQIITIIIVTLIIMFLYEMGYNSILYNDRKEMFEKIQFQEKRIESLESYTKIILENEVKIERKIEKGYT